MKYFSYFNTNRKKHKARGKKFSSGVEMPGKYDIMVSRNKGDQNAYTI